MRIGCHQAYVYMANGYEFAEHSLAVTILTIDKIRRDPNAFQKVCLIALAIIQGINHYYQTNYLPMLAQVLDNVQSFDFYGFFCIPHDLWHRYQAERIDEKEWLNQLEVVLCNNWHLGIADEEGLRRDPKVRQFAKEQLIALLKLMVEENIDFHSENQMKTFLQNWLLQVLKIEPKEEFDPTLINLHGLTVPFKKMPFIPRLLEFLTDAAFIVTDLLCVPLFLHEWSLIDLSFYVHQLGRLRLFGKQPAETLDDWIKISLCISFSFQFFKALYCLSQPDLKAEEATGAKCLIAASLAEFIYNYSMINRWTPRWLTFLLFTAKSIGLFQIMLDPKPIFFDTP